MSLTISADVTSAINAPYSEERVEGTGLSPKWEQPKADTETLRGGLPDISGSTSGTGLVTAAFIAGASQPTSTPGYDAFRNFAEPQGHFDPASKANRDRLELLARQFVSSNFSDEEFARLQIVMDRVARLVPRVSLADWEGLERVAKSAASIADRLEKRRADRERRRRG